MEYLPLETVPYYSDCVSLVSGLGYDLVSLKVIPQNGNIRVTAVISNRADGESVCSIGINDCAKVHRVLLPRLEDLLDSQDIYMEVTSPGTERVIKNGAEFSLFVGRNVKVWDSEISDWISGKIVSADQEKIVLESSMECSESKTESENQVIPYSRISKAKLLQI